MRLTGFWDKLFKRNARPEVGMEDAEDVFWSEMFEPRRIAGPLCWEPRTNWRTFWRDAGIDEPLDLSHVNREMSWGETDDIAEAAISADKLTFGDANKIGAKKIDIKEGAIATWSMDLSGVEVKDGLFVWVTNPRAHRLRSEIARLRRNKKKVSHLVAELAELEGGK